MAIITVGQQYRNEFESIVKLVQGGFLSSDVKIRNVSSGRIETDAHVFVLDGTFGASVQESAPAGFNKGGSSWFANFRGEKVNDNNGEWQMLIEAIAADYHKNYSFLEFKQEKTDAERQRETQLVQRFYDNVLTKIVDKIALSSPAQGNNAVMDIYGLSMKLDITGGVGQAEPILCKLYFRKDNGVFVPLEKGQAQGIETFINSAVPSDSDSEPIALDGEYRKVIDDVFFALSNCIEDKPNEEDNDFTDYVLFSDTDRKKVEFMLGHLANSEIKKLNCSNVQILGVSHVEWESAVFKLKHGDKEVLSVTVGLNDCLDVRCLNCNEDPLIVEANSVKGAEQSSGEIFKLDSSLKDFGVTSQVLEKLKQSSAFTKHLLTVDCSEFTENDCKRVACSSQVFVTDGYKRCKNCHHPEIVYVDIFDETSTPKVTDTLAFAYNKLALIEYEEKNGKPNLFRCPCCQKVYSSEIETIRGLCENCAIPDDSAEGKRKYKQYRKMLSPIIRLAHLKDEKTCKEYRTLIIFTLGNQKYIFDKLDVDDNKLIKGPNKYPRRK